MAMMLARRKGVTLATDYLIALRTRSSGSQVVRKVEGCVGRNSEAVVESAWSRRGISGVARWEGSLGQKQQQGLALLG
jgi:hypothetical protein